MIAVAAAEASGGNNKIGHICSANLSIELRQRCRRLRIDQGGFNGGIARFEVADHIEVEIAMNIHALILCPLGIGCAAVQAVFLSGKSTENNGAVESVVAHDACNLEHTGSAACIVIGTRCCRTIAVAIIMRAADYVFVGVFGSCKRGNYVIAGCTARHGKVHHLHA